MKTTEAVQNQYAACPYPPLETGARPEILPPASSWAFAHYYCHHRQSQNEKPLILDAGCGTGFSTLKLAQANPQAQIVAVDISGPSLALAQQRFVQAGLDPAQIHWHQADLQNLNLNQSFDFIYCTGVLHHLPDPAAALQHLRVQLKTEGLAAIMLYNPHARTEIRAIQQVLHRLWQTPDDLQEGLMLCRTFFQGLPSENPLKQQYLRDRKLIQQELGLAFADSEAFLVDTYLQVCEQEWELAHWWQIFEDQDWKILRFLDEESWKASVYLPGLPDYWLNLGEKERFCLIDLLRRQNNYLFFAGAANTASARQPLALKTNDIPRPSPLVQAIATETDTLRLENRLGQALELAPAAQLLWTEMDGKKSWGTLFQACLAQNPAEPQSGLRGLEHCAEQILASYFAWI
ncbi:hypothetical protein COW36_21605 [bacterium (Candidatus Blackallbacteria) CG17_big_fil_post_rev_8_21_14_2_50_48_46]|uniref:Methyltransferase domain-containing protein n=1 Tax=bacterium (Candidatus Blackallbacteria) CG17_big_fil_post_rev_8_21_14_2_50_48_46 TaxID=2014261 RepID=A0A2M7FZQ3_9BACT|nr:MAG: hypothetical protein COW64_14905 [bacterium (Candidatus Blackallbacteria) CG18_big_fil_WC_8_21_14_2_50_49_26]PIW14636.1 MAG: hypothetical protein COW36_21605 [bacterium (Candidatus Blackallbacteria) CG17_big_fil_post_rev_8_21_14_2_50_48_46]PIW45687.1 MAG: hypothetical protein COW20_19435 [bacterium (Candidatus Blackallbacteria) CG13_big_fil_rev_8_21_14_2_50_49_14]